MDYIIFASVSISLVLYFLQYCSKITFLSPQNQLNSYFVTAWLYWLGIAKCQKVLSLTLNLSAKLL